ncbi:cyclophilin-like domain-containing protein [Fimicolochytrium jonesii]|uniref:cyclophilin-like domain-containing protein n=1 Tax=Fimicolochytrium jonesii TaxID=1396493 RepID=UPI0022FE906C|nr:cyclophilin-like domain-containing protein [Fimicolochytrium jonesii]KAI8824416.1 cyclophilin-like domain-containing protein [Fimicolochytrium jonesii]
MPLPTTLTVVPFTPASTATSSSTVFTEKIIVTGDISHSSFHRAKEVAQAAAKLPNITTEFHALPQTAYTLRRHALQSSYSNLHASLFPHTLIELHSTTTTTHKLVNRTRKTEAKTTKKLLNVADLVTYAEGKNVAMPKATGDDVATKEHTRFLKSLGNPVVKIGFEAENADGNGEFEPLGRDVLIELFAETCPKTTRHFLQYVDGGQGGMSYLGSGVSRVVKGGWIECGEIRGPDGQLRTGNVLEDENFIHPHDPYTLHLIPSSSGPHTSTTPFMITTAAMPCFDKRYVAFGRVLEGLETLLAINGIECIHERPTRGIRIRDIEQWKEE